MIRILFRRRCDEIPLGIFSVQWKFLGIDYAMLPNCEWNQKQKHKKTALGQCGMLRIWRCDCALCVIGNEFPCRQPHNSYTTLLRGSITLLQG